MIAHIQLDVEFVLAECVVFTRTRPSPGELCKSEANDFVMEARGLVDARIMDVPLFDRDNYGAFARESEPRSRVRSSGAVNRPLPARKSKI